LDLSGGSTKLSVVWFPKGVSTSTLWCSPKEFKCRVATFSLDDFVLDFLSLSFLIFSLIYDARTADLYSFTTLISLINLTTLTALIATLAAFACFAIIETFVVIS
jgi:hypothetical protein